MIAAKTLIQLAHWVLATHNYQRALARRADNPPWTLPLLHPYQRQ